MKITTYEQIKKEIELPKFFKSGHSYYRVLDEKTLLHVKDFSNEDARFEIYPLIEVSKISYHNAVLGSYGFEAISEQDFKDAFNRVYLRLEEKMN
jgi:hypothetical protein